MNRYSGDGWLIKVPSIAYNALSLRRCPACSGAPWEGRGTAVPPRARSTWAGQQGNSDSHRCHRPCEIRLGSWGTWSLQHNYFFQPGGCKLTACSLKGKAFWKLSQSQSHSAHFGHSGRASLVNLQCDGQLDGASALMALPGDSRNCDDSTAPKLSCFRLIQF